MDAQIGTQVLDPEFIFPNRFEVAIMVGPIVMSLGIHQRYLMLLEQLDDVQVTSP